MCPFSILPSSSSISRDAAGHGQSLTGLIRGQAGRWKRRCALSSAHLGRLGPKASGLPILYSGRWAYGPRDQRMSPRGVLFDMTKDPAQSRNLVRRHPQVVARLSRQLRALLAQIGTPGEVVESLMGKPR